MDRHLLTGLRIAPHALALLPDEETAEGGYLDRLPTRQRIGHLVQDRLDQLRGLVPRKPDFLIDRFAELSPGDRLGRHHVVPLPAFRYC
jgi:hypothetical protein